MPEKTKSYDVVIVGGGVIGSACAYFLAREPGFAGSVLVVERDPAYRTCSTARSVGGIRQQFSTPENIHISLFAATFLKEVDAHLAVDGEPTGVPFVEAGYLFLSSPAGREVLQGNHRLQTALGARVALLGPDELARRFPWLDVTDVDAGSLGVANEGWTDPYALLQAFRRKARSLGVRYLADEVTGFERDGRRLHAVTLASGTRIGCSVVVNAAGPFAAEVASMAGVDLCVRPRKRQVFVFACREPIPDCPLVIDASGLYFRPEGPSFICGRSPPPECDPDCTELEVDYAQFEDELWPLLARRVPAFEAIRLTNAWACRYAYNTVDQNAIVGLHPERDNLLLANGFSGHGLQQSPAVGRGVAELVAFGQYRSLDLSRFSYSRIVEGRPIRELAVV